MVYVTWPIDELTKFWIWVFGAIVQAIACLWCLDQVDRPTCHERFANLAGRVDARMRPEGTHDMKNEDQQLQSHLRNPDQFTPSNPVTSMTRSFKTFIVPEAYMASNTLAACRRVTIYLDMRIDQDLWLDTPLWHLGGQVAIRWLYTSGWSLEVYMLHDSHKAIWSMLVARSNARKILRCSLKRTPFFS